jgi:hypothetical protein
MLIERVMQVYRARPYALRRKSIDWIMIAHRCVSVMGSNERFAVFKTRDRARAHDDDDDDDDDDGSRARAGALCLLGSDGALLGFELQASSHYRA